jgi:pilus assembly protein CpaB
LVQPGDRVDLVVYLRKTSEVPNTATKTILRDVNVFAVDAQTERKMDANGQQRKVRTVSLLVRPEQAETVMLASELGQLYLTLRRPDDNLQEKTDGVTVKSLLADDAESVDDRSTPLAETPGGSGFVQWLTNTASAAGQSGMPPAPPEPAWTMRVMTLDGSREFQWHDPAGLPQEVLPGAAFPAEASPPLTPQVSLETSPEIEEAAADEMDLGEPPIPSSLDAT